MCTHVHGYTCVSAEACTCHIGTADSCSRKHSIISTKSWEEKGRSRSVNSTARSSFSLLGEVAVIKGPVPFCIRAERPRSRCMSDENGVNILYVPLHVRRFSYAFILVIFQERHILGLFICLLAVTHGPLMENFETSTHLCVQGLYYCIQIPLCH